MSRKKLLVIWHGALFPSYRKPLWLLQLEHGWDVHLLCARSWRKALPRHTRFEPADNEPIKIHLHTPILAFHGALFSFPFFPVAFNRVKPDAVYVIEEPFSFMGWWAVYWCKRHVPNIPVTLFTYQDIYKQFPPPFSWMESFVLKHADKILVSNKMGGRTIMQKKYAGSWDILPTAVNLDHFSFREPRLGSTLFTLGYAGRLANEKGLDTLLWAMSELEDHVRLRIMGDGPARYRLELLAKELGVYERTAFLKAGSHEDLPTFYHEIDTLVLPSKTTANWQEQFGRVLVEAMACGVPVIGSDCGAIPEVIGDAGLIFPEGQASQLSEKILMLLHDSNLRRSLSLKGRVRAEHHYSAERVAKKLNEHLMEALHACRD